MRLVYDPVREHFLRPLIAAEPYIEEAIAEAVSTAVRGFEYLADKRLSMQRISYSALTYRTGNVRRYLTHGDVSTPSFEEFLTFASIVAIVTILNVAGYLNPYTVIPIALMDIRNINWQKAYDVVF